MMKNTFILITLLAAVLSINTPAVNADSGTYGTYGQYGGQPAPAQTILIDKKVGRPNGTATKGGVATYEYVDNLTVANARFKPGSPVMFQIRVKNTSTVTLNDVMVKDFVPSYLEPIEGFGNFDTATRIISVNAGSFRPDEEKIYYVKMQLFGQAQMPNDKGLFCLTNKVQAYNSVTSDEDTAQFCVEKEVMGAVEAPKAGPEAGILLAGVQTILLGVGFSLKKLSSKK